MYHSFLGADRLCGSQVCCISVPLSIDTADHTHSTMPDLFKIFIFQQSFLKKVYDLARLLAEIPNS